MAEYAEETGPEKIDELLSLETITEGWEDLGVKDAVHSYRRETQSGLYYIKGIGDMSYPAQTIYDLACDQTRKKRWDQIFVEGRMVHQLNDHSKVLYEQFSAPWPVSNRDFVCVSYTRCIGDVLVVAVFSVEHPSAPPVKGVVRAHMEIGGFIFRPLGNGQTRVTYTIFMDPKGSIPQMVVNSIQKKQTENVSKIRAFLDQSS